ncbi:hypothetical protein J6590_024812 [Homalodisca vitripennis]|nr:hypothetical protein J6590_024812 [Homalodisca vitripennis]
METNQSGSPKLPSKSLVPKPTRMPYINYVQAYRNTYQGPYKPSKDLVKLAAASWRKLTEAEKAPFVALAEVEKAKPRHPWSTRKSVKRLERRRR